MLEHFFKYPVTQSYDVNNAIYEPSKIIIDDDAAITRRYHYEHQGTALNECKFQCISTKFQLLNPMTKPGTPTTFRCNIWSFQMADMNNHNNG